MTAEESIPPPSASAFLNEHTHHSESVDNETKSSPRGATKIVSNLIEGLVRTGTGAGEEDSPERSGSSMKHRKESTRSYDQRLPKTFNADGDGTSSSVPYRGFSKAPVAEETPTPPARFAFLRHRLRNLFNPRATDIQQLLNKLQAQFQMLEDDHEIYGFERDGPMRDGSIQLNADREKTHRKHPRHPLNNMKVMSEVHFVGRKAVDSSIVELPTLLMNHDKFGSITELWLNDNLISDDGASAIASFLQSPTCALVELWLGDNRIGPSGTTLLAAALSNNEDSKLKCIGLYKNPICNGGASSLAQMLRGNHTLNTVDVHGCGSRSSHQQEVLEGYGCKVVKASDGTEYVARVVAPNYDDNKGLVTDQRWLDAIQTFVAFNRINPTREQAIRGMMTSNKQVQEGSTESINEQQQQTNTSKLLAELCNLPANEHLTNAEKRTWKDCEWGRLYVELERTRAAKSALASQLDIGMGGNEEKEGGDEVTPDEEEGAMENLVQGDNIDEDGSFALHQLLDDEVVKTDCRTWRDLKMNITGSARVLSAASPVRPKAVPKVQAEEHQLYVISDVDDEADGPDEATGPTHVSPAIPQAAPKEPFDEQKLDVIDDIVDEAGDSEQPSHETTCV